MIFGLMTVIGFALLVKIVIGALYSIGYRCSHRISDDELTNPNKVIMMDSKAQKYFQ
jgi:hypothetical protein